MQNQNIDHGNKFDWGKTSADYARFRDIYPPQFYEMILNRNCGAAGQRVLDVGTGTGVLPRNLYAAGAHWTGCDIALNKLHRQSSFRRAWRLLIWFLQRKRCQHLQSHLTGLQHVNVIGISMLQKQLQRLHGY